MRVATIAENKERDPRQDTKRKTGSRSNGSGRRFRATATEAAPTLSPSSPSPISPRAQRPCERLARPRVRGEAERRGGATTCPRPARARRRTAAVRRRSRSRGDGASSTAIRRAAGWGRQANDPQRHPGIVRGSRWRSPFLGSQQTIALPRPAASRHRDVIQLIDRSFGDPLRAGPRRRDRRRRDDRHDLADQTLR